MAPTRYPRGRVGSDGLILFHPKAFHKLDHTFAVYALLFSRELELRLGVRPATSRTLPVPTYKPCVEWPTRCDLI